MPLYEYLCDNCQYNFELKQSFKERPKKKCPECHKHKLRKIFYTPHIFTYMGDGEVSVGHLADRHRDNFSTDQKASIKSKNDHRRNKKRVSSEGQNFWEKNRKPSLQKIANYTPEQKQKYIDTGEVP